MGIFKNMLGTMKGIFHIGGPSGNVIKNDTDGLAVRNSADDAFKNILIDQASGAVDEHGVNYLDLKDTDVLIQFNFDGAAAPAPGANTGTYGFCHTSGGASSGGQVYYDDGVALRPIKLHVGSQITTGSAITGTVSLGANGIYVAHSGGAPYTWTLKGDGSPGGDGYFRVLEIPIDTTASKSSSTAIPDGAVVYSAGTKITTGYDNGATIQVLVDGSSDLTIQTTDENDPAIPNSYSSEVEDGHVTATTEGPVTVNIANAPSTGAGVVSVYYTTTALA